METKTFSKDLLSETRLFSVHDTQKKLTDDNMVKAITVNANLNYLGYTLKLSEAAKDYIAEKGFDKQFGARPLKRAIQKYVEDALAEEIITHKIHEGDQIFMDLDETAQELKIEIKKLEKPSS